MKFIVALILTLVANLIYAQNPLVKQWDYRFGGNRQDKLVSLQHTSDKGFILGGHSQSGISGDKTQQNWDVTYNTSDYWIVKVDSMGNKEWDRRFGGTNDDQLSCLVQTLDGGYMLGGYSNSDSSGDRTESSRGDYDYWVVKTDSLGNKQWDRRFGGFDLDDLLAVQQTTDGGYILGGYSYSGVSGDKSQPSWGNNDYWIVKLDSFGSKQWDKRFGGFSYEYFFSLQQTADDGFILSGYSWSGISGDKTQLSRGGPDYWLVKINASGIKEWDCRFGGSGADRPNSVELTADGGFIIGGFSDSDISGDKTQPSWGGYDFWIVATDSMGAKLWDKDFGGINDEEKFGNILHTVNGGYLFSGASYSPFSGDKSENNLGPKQVWIINSDSLGNKQWDKTLFTTGSDDVGFTVQISDSCYATATFTNGGIGGYKTQTNRDSANITTDYWIIKLCDSSITTNIASTLLNYGDVYVAPNPFIDEIVVSIQEENVKSLNISIKNLLGNTVFSKQVGYPATFYKTKIDLSYLSKGIYMMDVVVDGKRTVKKIMCE